MNAKLWKWLVVVTLSIMALQLVWVELGFAQDGEDGYISRACGFDMNDDGVRGDTSDVGTNGPDCAVCDGNQTTGAFTADPDGDTVNEDLYWVDCTSGTNSGTGVNAPNTAYRTLAYAIAQLNGTTSNKEDIICVRGTCRDANGSGVSNQTLNKAGVTLQGPGGNSYFEVAAAEDEPSAMRYPADPFMIVGWDTDQDGDYPPHDSGQAEPLIFDAFDSGDSVANAASFLSMGSADNVELAHFTVMNYGRGRTDTGSAFVWTSITGYADQHSIHDIIIDSNWRGVANSADRRGFSFNIAGSGNGVRYLSIENVQLVNSSSWALRGWQPAPSTTGPILLDHFTLENHHSTGGSQNVLGLKFMTGHETVMVRDSSFVTGPDTSTTVGINALFFESPMGPTYVASNTFDGFNIAIKINAKDDANYGPNGAHIIRRNIFRMPDGVTNVGSPVEFIRASSEGYDGLEPGQCTSCTTGATGQCAADPTGGNTPDWNIDCDCDQAVSYIAGLTVEGNLFDFNDMAASETYAALSYQNGSNCSAPPNSVANVNNNTVKNYGPGSTANCAFMFGTMPGEDNWDFLNVTGDVYFFNNLVEGDAGACAVRNHKIGANGGSPSSGNPYYTPGTDFFAGKNIYNGVNRWRLGSTLYTTLASWDSAVGAQENDSIACAPVFATDGYHLSASESTSCARNFANNTYCPAYDIDGQLRPLNTTCEMGVDEVSGAATTGTVQFASSSYGPAEGVGTQTVSVTRVGGTSGAGSASYATASGTATGGSICTAGVDYVSVSSSFSGATDWDDGSAATKTFDVAICDDVTPEGDETFTVNLSSPTGVTLGTPASATVTIASSDASEPPVTSGDYVTNCDGSADGQTVTILNVPGDPFPLSSDGKMVVGVAATADFNSVTPADPDCDMSLPGASVVWNGHTFTRVGSRVDNNGPTYSECVALYEWPNPEGVTGNVVVTFPDVVHRRNAGATVIYGVDPAVPTIVASADGLISSPATRSLSVVTTAANSFVVDVLGVGNRVNAGNALEGSGQVQIAEAACGTTQSHMMMSGKVVATPFATNMAWTWTTGSPERYAHLAAVYAPAPMVTTTTSTTTTTTLPSCGDGIVDVGEECDCVGACSAAELDNKKCSNFAPLAEGTLSCNADCTFHFTGCTRTTRGRVGVLRALGWCEASSEPACGGTCPAPTVCTDAGSFCECQ